MRILILLFVAIQAQAQMAGLRGGVAVSNLTQTDFSAHTGFYAGVVGNFKSGGIYTLQPEMGFLRVGAKGDISYEVPRVGVVNEKGIVADYVYLNIMNKFSFHPAFGILVGPGWEQEVSNHPALRKQWDLAVNLGIDVKLSSKVGFEARVRRGTRDLYNGSHTLPSSSELFLWGENSFLAFQAGMFYYFAK
ncbi:outer membrane beta-barrel protein [Leadbetterella byssophila]|uniref:outer membrane beta-barrel protein n=1 Tax=Leadbetterella byssophila TaxID=316068 RepID=UPI0039A111D5